MLRSYEIAIIGNVNKYYFTWLDRPIFCCRLSSLKFVLWAHNFSLFLQEWCFSRSRSSKVIDVGTNWKRVCDFLLVCNSNLGLILHRFTDFEAFLWSWWPHPYSSLISGVFPLNHIAFVGVKKSRDISYSAMKLFSKYSNLCDHGTYKRHRQTDERRENFIKATLTIIRIA